MQVRVETFEGGCGHRQFGDAEQRLLQLFGAFAIDHLGLQFVVGLLQREGPLFHPPFQFHLGGLAVQRGENVLRDVLQQCAILSVVAVGVLVVLHHDRATDLRAAQQRYAQPVLAERPTGVFLAGDVHAQQNLARRPDQRLAVLQQRRRHAVDVLVDREFGFGIGIEAVAAVGEVQVADRRVLAVVLDDVEILRRHQSADDLMDPRQHVVHFQAGACEIGDFVQGLLEALRFFQRLDPRTGIGEAQ